MESLYGLGEATESYLYSTFFINPAKIPFIEDLLPLEASIFSVLIHVF